MTARLRVNPLLNEVLNSNPDIFAYAECLVYKTIVSPLPKYSLILHKAKQKTNRRGIAIFIKNDHMNNISQDFVSSKYDIIWLRYEYNSAKTNSRDIIILCFFYAPGENQSEDIRSKFYNDLSIGMSRYPNDTKIFMMGDCNARLGVYSQDRAINGKYVTNKNNSLLLGFLKFSGLIYVNRIFTLGVPTYQLAGKKQSIIDISLTNHISSVKSFSILPHILGVNPQTSHKIINLEIYCHAKQKIPGDHFKSTRKLNFCSYKALTKIKEIVSARISNLHFLRPMSDRIYQYKIFVRIYNNVKKSILGFKKTDIYNPKSVSPTIKKLPNEISSVSAFEKESELKIFKLKLLHKRLLHQWSLERQLKFKRWLSKLNKLGYTRATRSFYAELKSKSIIPEQIRPIRNKRGVLSPSLLDCLKNWRDFYKNLYKKPEKLLKLDTTFLRKIRSITMQDINHINRDISWQEVVLAVDTLGDYSSPGADNILNRDLTILLHEGEDGKADKDSLVIMHYFLKMLQHFWKIEMVPGDLKQSIIKPFLKDATKDASLPQNYRPISLLNTPMKVYEQVIKARLVDILEKTEFFSNVQSAYRKGRSTCDHILVLQEIFLHYSFNKNGPRVGKG